MPAGFKQLETLNAEQWQAFALKFAPLAVCLFAMVGIAWQASQLTWLLAVKPDRTAGAMPKIDAAPPPPRANVDVQAIANAHLFGLPTAEAQPNAANVPQTQMSLVLAGTIAFDDPDAGFAIVGESAANAKFYAVGGMIGGTARLHSVYADRVILDRGGRLEALSLPRGAPSTAVTAAARPAPANPVGDNLRRLAQNNPSAIGEMLRAQPVFAGGAQRGYRVYPGRDRQQFVRLGLQPGDLITSINGTALDDPMRSNEILNTFASSSTVAVTVERNGAAQQLTLDIAQLSLPDAGSAPVQPADSAHSDAATPGEDPAAARTNRGLRNRTGTPPVSPGRGAE